MSTKRKGLCKRVLHVCMCVFHKLQICLLRRHTQQQNENGESSCCLVFCDNSKVCVFRTTGERFKIRVAESFLAAEIEELSFGPNQKTWFVSLRSR